MGILYKKQLWLVMSLLLAQSITAQEKMTKKIEKSYLLTDIGELHLNNKYGNINLYGWKKNEVSITINITVSHRKKDNAEDLLERFHPIFRNSENYVSVDYRIADKSSSFFGNLFEKANPFDFDRSNVQIDYTVYLPAKAELDVSNIFGDVVIEDWVGELHADIEHGDLWINENLGRVNINVKYGKLKAQSIDYGTITLKNGGIDMENGKNLKVNSSGSDIKIEKVNSLEFFSNKDEVTLDEAGMIYGTIKFTTIQLDRLVNDADLTLKISDFRISEILDPDADIAIDQESSEVSLNVTDFAHRFTATLEEGLARLPKTYKNVDSEMLDKGKRIRKISASYGKDAQGKITITGKKGVVLMKEL